MLYLKRLYKRLIPFVLAVMLATTSVSFSALAATGIAEIESPAEEAVEDTGEAVDPDGEDGAVGSEVPEEDASFEDQSEDVAGDVSEEEDGDISGDRSGESEDAADGEEDPDQSSDKEDSEASGDDNEEESEVDEQDAADDGSDEASADKEEVGAEDTDSSDMPESEVESEAHDGEEEIPAQNDVSSPGGEEAPANTEDVTGDLLPEIEIRNESAAGAGGAGITGVNSKVEIVNKDLEAIEKLIAALPDADKLDDMSTKKLGRLYAEVLEISDLIEALEGEIDEDEIDSLYTENFLAILEYFDNMLMTLEDADVPTSFNSTTNSTGALRVSFATSWSTWLTAVKTGTVTVDGTTYTYSSSNPTSTGTYKVNTSTSASSNYISFYVPSGQTQIVVVEASGYKTFTMAIQSSGASIINGFTISPEELSLSPGDTSALSITITQTGSWDLSSKIEWTSSDSSVASVSGGTVTAVGAGIAAITATLGGYSATCEVTVASAESHSVTVNSAEGGSISADKESASKGDTVTLTATANDGYELESLSVTKSDGNMVTTTKTTEGTYTFTMPDSDVTVSATFAQEVEYTISIDSTLSLTIGSTSTLTAAVTPAGASITWTSSDSGIATVDGNGTVTGIAEGTATITATVGSGDKEKQATCTVTVTKGSASMTGYELPTGTDAYYTLSFTPDDYVSTVTGVLCNGVSCSAGSSKTYLSGTQYYLDASSNQICLANQSWSTSDTTFKSGDVITLKSSKYGDIKLKIIIANGETTIIVDDGEEGDGYTLYVRLVGSFESAIVGQSDYDAVSGASTNVSTNKNSDVEVQVALIKTGTEPTEDDWTAVSDAKYYGTINVTTGTVTISPDGSGMAGVYSTYDSSLTLAGTPAKAGTYEIYVTVTDDQGRTATSNSLEFIIYDSDEIYLENVLTLDNCTEGSEGYMYDMEPWTIVKFVDRSTDASASDTDKTYGTGTVTVPAEIVAWYGSHTSGTYGYLGYAVGKGNEETEILVIPAGCDLTIVNMNILSSVKIIVEAGAKLTLLDSVVNGTIECYGTFSMNYDSFAGEFTSGASIDGQLIMKDGSTLENASIYSNVNSVDNGDGALSVTDAVVVVEGNVTLKGSVYIRGDEGGTATSASQTGLELAAGATLTLEEGAVLAVFSGVGYDITTSNGGDAIVMNSGSTITGSGKLIAIGGEGCFGSGGNAVSGSGTISTDEAYLQGGSAWQPKSGCSAGDAATEGIIISCDTERTLIDGIEYSSESDNPHTPYWTGTAAPDGELLGEYTVEAGSTRHIDHTYAEARDATCEEAGNCEYYSCSECGGYMLVTESADDAAYSIIVNGETVYLKHATEAEVTIEALGHDWDTENPEWTWTETDGSYSAAVTFTCKNDSSHTQTVDAVVTSETESDGSLTYTANATFGNQSYTDTKTVTVSAEGGDNEDPGEDEERENVSPSESAADAENVSGTTDSSSDDSDSALSYQKYVKPVSSGATQSSGTWEQTDDAGYTWKFRLSDGTYAAGGCYYIRNPYSQSGSNTCDWFRFNNDGIMQYGWWSPEGEPAVWYYFHAEKDGDLGKMERGWHYDNDDGRTYYLDPASGVMVSGLTMIDGYEYYFEKYEDVPFVTWIDTGDGSQDWTYTASGVRSYGSMYVNETTPDGSIADDEGRIAG